jgi:hypothetical protein
VNVRQFGQQAAAVLAAKSLEPRLPTLAFLMSLMPQRFICWVKDAPAKRPHFVANFILIFTRQVQTRTLLGVKAQS